MTTTRDLTCPTCQRVNEAHDGTNTTDQPSAGDVSICWSCGSLAIFTEAGLRATTETEEIDLRADPDIRAALAAIRESYTPLQAIDLARGGRF